MKFKKLWLYILTPLLVLLGSVSLMNPVQAQDLTDKVTLSNVEIRNSGSGTADETFWHSKGQKEVRALYYGEYSFPNLGAGEIKNGDYFTVKAPDGLDLVDATFELKDSVSGEVLGQVTASSATKTITFTFNEKAEDKQDIRGTFNATSILKTTGEVNKVTYRLPGGKEQTITFKPSGSDSQDVPVEGEIGYKGGWTNSDTDHLAWWMRINRAGEDLTGKVVKINDSIDTSKGSLATYLVDSFKFFEAEYKTKDTSNADVVSSGHQYKVTTDPAVYQANPDDTALLTLKNGGTSFELLLPTNTGTKTLRLEYSTTTPADGTEVVNSAGITYDGVPQKSWKSWDGKDTGSTTMKSGVKSVKGAGATVTADLAGKIKITKYDEADATVKLSGVVFEILKKSDRTKVAEITTDEHGVALSPVLSEGQYIVKEKAPKSGYIANSQEFEVEMKKEGVPLNISNKRETVDFEATKTWVGGKASDYKKVKLGLYVHKEGQTIEDSKPVSGSYTPEVTESNGVYTYKWAKQLPKYDVDGTKLIYSVRELQDTTELPLKEGEKVASNDHNYIVSYNADKTQVTNTYEVPKTKVTANKVWTGGTDSVRPSLFFKLYRTLEGGTEEAVTDADQKEVPKTDGAVEWSDLPATDQNGVTYTYSVKEVDKGGNPVTTVDGYTSEQTAELTVTNKYAVKPTSASLEVTKKLTGRELKADEFEFTLTDQAGNVETAKNDANGKVKFKELTFNEAGTYTYKIAEKAGTATGIQYDTKTITATVTVADNGKGVLEATVAYDGEKAFENTYTPAGATSVTLGAKKVLEGKNLEAGKYSFELKKEDGSVVETVTNAADGTVTFSPISYDESQVGTHQYTISEVAGTEAGITYDKTVQEVEVTVEKVSATELKATASKEAKDLVFTNKYTPAKTSVSVKKAWDDKDNQDGKRPSSVTVKLLADGQDTGKTLELNAANGWTGSFTNLDADKGGTPIKYTVVEVTVDGYTPKVTGDAASGFTITNSYSPETVVVKATKNWDDANNQDGKRPTKITINLLADGQKVASKEVQAAADGTWTATFEKLAKYKAGKEITYTVTEEAVAEYESTITDFTITNKYAPKEIDYKVTKVWNDANNQDGKRPESVTVQLYKKVGDADPVAVEGKKLTLTAKDKTDANTWVASFTNLPQYEAGKEITYSIKEVDVPAGYEASVTGQVVTNTHTPETVVLSGTKVWKDNNNQDGKRADKVKVQILNGDKVVQEIEVSEATGWKFESKALPKYENGQEIKYTVKEVAVKDYTSTVTTDKGKYTVTNTHAPEKTSVKGHKIWKDEENKDGIRPASITVKLLADGQDTGKTAVASEATGWTYEFTDLDRYKDGQAIEYSVVEVPVEGYSSKVEGFNITNTHTPEKPTPGKPNEPGKPGPKPQLPNTGEKASNAAVVAGLALMAVTGGLYFVSRKNK
ncbi:Cna B-type domain-containing protein [Streptococcus sp. CF8-6]|uniref:Cna B-type domain-containing protein n=1 Tax=Streptococcus sp. CF8-6 TaxID=2963150 RepID=UPI0020C8F6C0|nr:Cna B-type domain-containing protein [Streptococcus sp. CF8-6]MCP9017462.1 Cna B-type domain-containing protein [Streptococcus sp. CF8-6]